MENTLQEGEKKPLLDLAFLLGIHILHFRATDRRTAFNRAGVSKRILVI